MRVERVKLPSLHQNQKLIYDDIMGGRKYTVLVAGRRFGKSFLALALAIEMAVNRGMRVWWVAPTHNNSDKQWRMAKNILRDIPTRVVERDKRMEFNFRNPDGTRTFGEIAFKTAKNVDNLRGDGLDFVIIDEAAFCHPNTWSVLSPALVDRDGGALFISTPNGLNWFYNIFRVAEQDDTGTYQSWHFTSYDNPTLSRQSLDLARTSMKASTFDVEHMGKFTASEGRVFANVDAVAVATALARPKEFHTYSMGIDWGRREDATVISIIDIQDQRQVYLERLTKNSWALQKDKVIRAYNLFHPTKVIIEENAAGGVIIEELQALGMSNITAFYTTNQSKLGIIDGLAMAIEKKNIAILADTNQVTHQQLEELRAYEIQETRASNNRTYNAPTGMKDDCVIALALAWSGVNTNHSILHVSENKFYGSGKTVQQMNKTFPSLLDRYKKKRAADASSN